VRPGPRPAGGDGAVDHEQCRCTEEDGEQAPHFAIDDDEVGEPGKQIGFALKPHGRGIEVGGEDFYIDLLFYHLKLRCYIVLELKTGKFIPEYASKLNFYLNATDDLLKHTTDQPSIGILICKERNKVVAEYALRGINKPIGVSEYELTEKIPASLKRKLPTIKQIENELKSIKEPK